MLERCKPSYNRILLPFVRPLLKMGFSPDLLTITGLALFCIAAWCASTGMWKASFIFAAAGSLFDGLDGVAARESSRETKFGAILDSSCDRLTEIILIFGLFVFYMTPSNPSLENKLLLLPLYVWGAVLCYTAITLSTMVSYVKARCEGAGVSCHRGLLQRPERMLLICIGLLAGPSVMVFILAAVSAFAAFTVSQRLSQAYFNTARKKKNHT